MSRAPERAVAAVFSALGDDTRLAVMAELGRAGGLTATTLAVGARVSRQAIVKHLRVLEGARLVSRHRRGREVLYAVEPERLADARGFLDAIAARWDRALERLRAYVEEPATATRGAGHGRRRRD